MIDFANCKVDYLRAYDGANGSKICVFYNDERYMIKFPSLAKDNPQMHYSNGCLNEFIASSIYQTFNINTHQTILGTYNGKEVVACKDFCAQGEKIINFGMIKNQCIDSEKHGYGTELGSILDAIDKQQLYDPVAINEHFWKMFAADALLGNFDRHNGNWGIIVNEITQEVRIAPVYDNASCLYPQLTDEQMKYILSNQNEINNRVYVFPNSAIKENDKKINYLDFLQKTKDRNCLDALMYVSNNYNAEKVSDAIYSAPISKIKKDFYTTMIKERKEKIIDYALEQQKKYCVKLSNGTYISREEFSDRILNGKDIQIYTKPEKTTYSELDIER